MTTIPSPGQGVTEEELNGLDKYLNGPHDHCDAILYRLAPRLIVAAREGNAAVAALAAAQEPKMFPLHSTGLEIHWSVAEHAYETYAKKYGTDQSLKRLGERGGFSVKEMDSYFPEWREANQRESVVYKEVESLRAALAVATEQLRWRYQVEPWLKEGEERELPECQDAMFSVWTDVTYSVGDGHYAVGIGRKVFDEWRSDKGGLITVIAWRPRPSVPSDVGGWEVVK